ncbi:MAG: DUF4254 domain-containing protein [Thermonemataceae bacterium]
MTSAAECYGIFQQSIDDSHREDHVDTPIRNPYEDNTKPYLLYLKNWIDTVQWHLEDIIREPQIDPLKALTIKRRIDLSNQYRTDTVEKLDDYFLATFKDITPKPTARLNSETPAWLLDRMSILMLKIYHMKEQTTRTDVSLEHIETCTQKLVVLKEQQADMGMCFDQLMEDIQKGDRYMKVYRQMKMYNDENLNPVLYKKKESE